MTTEQMHNEQTLEEFIYNTFTEAELADIAANGFNGQKFPKSVWCRLYDAYETELWAHLKGLVEGMRGVSVIQYICMYDGLKIDCQQELKLYFINEYVCFLAEMYPILKKEGRVK